MNQEPDPRAGPLRRFTDPAYVPLAASLQEVRDRIDTLDRQIVTLPPGDGMAWLNLSQPQQAILRAPPAGAFQVRTLRKDGVEQAA